MFMHCMIHRFALSFRLLPTKLSLVVNMVNHVKESGMIRRLFKLLCALLFHTTLRWISRANATKRVYELYKELMEFFPTIQLV